LELKINLAVLAQLVEHFHGKEEVSGPIPENGSKEQNDRHLCGDFLLAEFKKPSLLVAMVIELDS
jgi:hypothetical protein